MNKVMIFFLGIAIGVLVSLPFSVKVGRVEVMKYNCDESQVI